MPLFFKEVTISPRSLKTSESFKISVNVEDVTWGTIKNNFQSWNDVKQSFEDWGAVRDFVYTVSDTD